jgi:hypothetical protein
MKTYHFSSVFRRFFLLSVTVAELQFIIGCAVIPDFPQELPRLVAGDEKFTSACPDLAGRYRDKGEAFSPEGNRAGEVSLSQILHGDDAAFAEAESVVAVADRDSIEIRSLKNGAPFALWRTTYLTREKYLSEGGRASLDSYICTRGFVQITRENHLQGEPLGAGVGSDLVFLRKAVDGSMIVLHRADAGALILWIVPVPLRRPIKLWYRFPPAD